MYVYQLSTLVNRGSERATWADLQLLNESNESIEAHIQVYAFNAASGYYTPAIYFQQAVVLSAFGRVNSGFNVLNLPTSADYIGVKITTTSEYPDRLTSTLTLKNALLVPIDSTIIPFSHLIPKYAYIVNSGDDTVLVLDRYTHEQVGNLIELPLGALPVDIATSKYSTLVYTANSGTDNGSTIYTHGNEIWPVVLQLGPDPVAIETDEPYGLRVFAVNNDSPISTVTVFNLLTNAIDATIPVGDNAVALTFNATNNQLYVANQDDGTISVIDTTTNTVVTTIPLLPGVPNNSAPVHLVSSPDDKYVYVAAQGLPGEIQVIDAETNTLLPSPIFLPGLPSAAGYIPKRLSISEDSMILFVAFANYNGIVSLNVKSPAVPNLFPDILLSSGSPEDIAITPDGWELYIINNWSSGSTVTIWDRRTNTLSTLPLPTGFQPQRIALSRIIV